MTERDGERGESERDGQRELERARKRERGGVRDGGDKEGVREQPPK